MPLTADDDIRELLEETRTIALVGASDRPDRPSNGVMKTLQAHGYRRAQGGDGPLPRDRAAAAGRGTAGRACRGGLGRSRHPPPAWLT